MNPRAPNFTDLYPKRGDINGSIEQALVQEPSLRQIWSMPSMLTPYLRSSQLPSTQCKFSTSLTQRFTLNWIERQFLSLANASNKMGKFSLVHLHMTKIALFPCVIQKEVTNILSLGKDIPPELLIATTWEKSEEKFACVSVPNIFFIYFSQPLPKGKITSDTTKMAFHFLFCIPIIRCCNQRHNKFFLTRKNWQKHQKLSRKNAWQRNSL